MSMLPSIPSTAGLESANGPPSACLGGPAGPLTPMDRAPKRSRRLEIEIPLSARPPNRFGDWRIGRPWKVVFPGPATAATTAIHPAKCLPGQPLGAALPRVPLEILFLLGRGFPLQRSALRRSTMPGARSFPSIAPLSARSSFFRPGGRGRRRHRPIPFCPTLCRLLGDCAESLMPPAPPAATASGNLSLHGRGQAF